MPVRATMSTLIARVRLLVGDESNTVFQDQEVQDALDRTRMEQRNVRLKPLQTFLTGGRVTFLDYQAHDGDWESGPVLQDSSFAAVTPGAVDEINGRWTLTDELPNGPFLMATGATYDTALAAANLVDVWAGRKATEFSFTTDGQQFDRASQAQALRDHAKALRSRAKIVTNREYRADSRYARSGTPTVNGMWGPGAFGP